MINRVFIFQNTQYHIGGMMPYIVVRDLARGINQIFTRWRLSVVLKKITSQVVEMCTRKHVCSNINTASVYWMIEAILDVYANSCMFK